MAEQSITAYFSSTFAESSEYFRVADDRLSQMGIKTISAARSYAEAGVRISKKGLRDSIASSAIFVGVYGDRSVDFPPVLNPLVLIEMEYDLARKLNRPCFFYFLESLGVSDHLNRRDWDKLQALKKKVESHDHFSEFTNADDLAEMVYNDINRWLISQQEPTQQASTPLKKSAKKKKIHAQQNKSTAEEPTINDKAHPLSRSAVEAIGRAEAFRLQVGETEVNSNLVLLGLLTEPNGPAQIILNATGMKINQAAESISKFEGWSNAPTLNTPFLPPYKKSPRTPNAILIEKRAGEHAAEENRRKVRTHDLFVAILETPGALAYKWLENNFRETIPIDWIKQTLQEWSADKDFTIDEVQRKINADRPAEARAARSDSASEVDKLNFDVHAKALAEIILKPETVPPVVIGVYGPWGSGKSTFLNLVQKNLGQLQKLLKEAKKTSYGFIPIEYNAWAYTDSAKLWAGLVQKVSEELNKEMTRWQRFKYALTRRTRRFLAAFIIGLIPLGAAFLLIIGGGVWGLVEDSSWDIFWKIVTGALGLAGSLGISLYKLPSFVNTVFDLTKKFDASQMTGVMNKVREEMQEVIQKYFVKEVETVNVHQKVREGKIKVVVFIDELDRCPLNRIVDILEAIKLFLAEEIFIVLLAIDTRVAAEAIQLHYKDVINPEIAREYLEKIVQIPLQVPKAKKTDVEKYLGDLMNISVVETRRPAEAQPQPTKEEDGSSQPAPVAVPAPTGVPVSTQPVPASGRPEKVSTPPAPAWKPLELTDTQDEYDLIVTMGVRFLESNPRRMKRLLNTYRYVKIICKRISRPTHEKEWQERMIAWLTFTLVWPDFMLEAIQQAKAQISKPTPDFLIQCFKRLGVTSRIPNVPSLTEDNIKTYLNLSAKQVLEMVELASNFLIENPWWESISPKQKSKKEHPENSATNAKSMIRQDHQQRSSRRA